MSLSGQTVTLGPWGTVVKLFLWALSLTFIFLAPPHPICSALEIQLVLGRANVLVYPVARSSHVKGAMGGLRVPAGTVQSCCQQTMVRGLVLPVDILSSVASALSLSLHSAAQ